MNDCKKEYERWLKYAKDESVQNSLRKMSEQDVINAFSKDLQFGTAGLRGIMTAGTDRMNVYTVYRATEGLARYMDDRKMTSCAVTYDSRFNGKLFGEITAATLACHGIKVYFTKECMPTPFLSFMVRYYECSAGVNVTASHNPSDYNGYKVYDSYGCQLTDEAALKVTEYIERVDTFEKPLPDFNDYIGKQIVYCGGEAEKEYVKCVLSQSLSRIENLSAVYTPLNGAGYKIVPETLRLNGLDNLTVVNEQSKPDGRFLTCPYPNPEKREALNLAIKLAEEKQSDIVIANDPDCDRLGVAVKDHGGYVQLNGNEVGVLLLDYVLTRLASKNELPKNPVVVKTIVTTPMVDAVAAKYGAEVKDVLTGFKYIGDVINKLEKKGERDRFVFGFEESCGYLKGSYVRDKDGVIASLLIAECADYHKRSGKTLCGRLNELYAEFGMYASKQISYRFDGVEGEAVKAKLLSDLRNASVTALGNSPVENKCDFLTQTEYDLPKSDVLRLNSKDGSRLIIRPSGTEPLVKCYISVCGDKEENEIKFEAIKRQLDKLFDCK